jgi:hypothetical protein
MMDISTLRNVENSLYQGMKRIAKYDSVTFVARQHFKFVSGHLTLLADIFVMGMVLPCLGSLWQPLPTAEA